MTQDSFKKQRMRRQKVRMTIGEQLAFLFILGLPIASVAWTVTHEEVFREPREWFKERNERGKRLAERKFFYLFTCEYCFSHYVVIAFLILTRFKLLLDDWRGYVIAFFALVWVANVYMNIYARVRLDIKKERVEIEAQEKSMNGSEQARRINGDRCI